MTLKHVSTFSGVGGIDLGFERAGIETVAMAEVDPRARGVLADRFPQAHLFHDVKDVTADALYELGLDPRRTVLSGGFPCQDLSVAGARRGLGEGTRSGLYWELDRIMGEFRPAWVVLENVPGLLSAACACPGDGTCTVRGLAATCERETHSVPGGGLCWGECIPRHGGVMGAVLGSLAERGYGFAYRVLDAQHFGVPQRRRRVVIVGHLGDAGGSPATVLLEPEGVPWDPCEGIPTWTTPSWAAGSGVEAGRGVGGTVARTQTADGHDASEDGSSVVAYVADQASTLQSGGGDRGYRIDAEGAAGGQLVAYAADNTSALDTQRGGADDNAAQGGHLVATYQKVIRPASSEHPDVWEERSVAATLSPFDLGSDSRAVDIVVESPIALAPRGSEHGDGPTRDVVLSPTLTAALGEGGWAGHNRKDELVERTFEAGASVRRLTPVECERLQGFPDDWTLTSGGKVQSDSKRYMQMGNAVAVPVFEWVGRRLVAVDALARH